MSERTKRQPGGGGARVDLGQRGGAGPLEKESELQKIQPSETSNSCRRSRSTELAERLITKEDMRGRRTPDAAKISMSHNVRRSKGRCVSRNWQAREK